MFAKRKPTAIGAPTHSLGSQRCSPMNSPRASPPPPEEPAHAATPPVEDTPTEDAPATTTTTTTTSSEPSTVPPEASDTPSPEDKTEDESPKEEPVPAVPVGTVENPESAIVPVVTTSVPDTASNRNQEEEAKEHTLLEKSQFSIGANWWIDYDELGFKEKLHDEGGTKIYEGEYKDEPVAIRVYDVADIDASTFAQNFNLLGDIRSTQMAFTYGLCLEPKICVVCELFLVKENLQKVLNDFEDDFTWREFFKASIELVNVLKMLHGHRPPIIHNAIRPVKLMVTDEGTLKIADLASAQLKGHDDELISQSALNKKRQATEDYQMAPYRAPESFAGKTSEKSDIYSAGVVLWEMANRILTGSHMRPHRDLAHSKDQQENIATIEKFTTMGKRPSLPSNCPESLGALISACWHQEPEQRPPLPALLKQIKALEVESRKSKWAVAEIVETAIDSDEESASESMMTPRPRSIAPAALEPVLVPFEHEIPATLKKSMQGGALAQIKPSEVTYLELIDSGEYGEAWKAEVYGIVVVVKKLFAQSADDKLVAQLTQELEIKLNIRHNNIQLLMGACIDPANLMVVMQYCSGGTIYQLLHEDAKRKPSTLQQRFKIALEVALGLNWLHCSKPIVLHQHLTSKSVFLDKTGVAKISGFGTIKIHKEPEEQYYQAPEVGRGEVTAKSDVYSYGVLLWELLLRELPYTVTEEDGVRTIEARSFDIPPGCPPEAKNLIRACMSTDPANRPSIDQILYGHMLESALISHSLHDISAANFWNKAFLSGITEIEAATRPAWGVFKTGLTKYFAQKEITGMEARLTLMAMALFGHEEGSLLVSIDRFNQFLTYFGPFEAEMLDRVVGLASCKAFHGYISKHKAEKILSSRPKGSWLIRYAEKGSFVISVHKGSVLRGHSHLHHTLVRTEPSSGTSSKFNTYDWKEKSRLHLPGIVTSSAMLPSLALTATLNMIPGVGLDDKEGMGQGKGYGEIVGLAEHYASQMSLKMELGVPVWAWTDQHFRWLLLPD
eukprot:TRINITY_DN4767_c0_g1_i1.p1 TRINITY_DN4767_c0_g1~~TRINITY_DN4767_c0_g1_i1.p1  ORF type:complete len:1014 (+),score=151.40 TRINITY_DN4767_c0_g1_i1:138-3179(+)